MGAFLGFEVAQRFAAQGLHPPVQVFVAGRQAPSISCDFVSKPVRQMSDLEFADELGRLNVNSLTMLRDNPELLALVMPSLRADFEICETYLPSGRGPAPFPIASLCGDNDNSVEPWEAEAWRDSTAAEFSFHRIPGDHFFVNSNSRQVLEIIARTLAGRLG
jgi:surfactin synthase thioesterase subunit